eukprot:1874766-Pyramimonas_sp.AAC.1
MEDLSATLTKRQANKAENGSAAPTLGNTNLPRLQYVNSWLHTPRDLLARQLRQRKSAGAAVKGCADGCRHR